MSYFFGFENFHYVNQEKQVELPSLGHFIAAPLIIRDNPK